MRDTGEMKNVREEIYRMTNRIGEIRKEMKLCEDVAMRSGAVIAVIDRIYDTHSRSEQELINNEERKEKGK